MEQQFELLRVKKSQGILLVLGGVVGGIALAVAGLVWLPIRGFWGAMLWLFAAIGGMILSSVLVLEKWTTQPISLLLTDQELTVIEQLSGARRTVSLRAIKSYRLNRHYGAQELYLTLQDGNTLRLDAHTRIGHNPADTGLVQAVEIALRDYRAQQGFPELIRGKTFFEKPIAKLIPALVTIGTVYAGWVALHRDLPNYTGLLRVVGSYLSFLAVWAVAIKRSKTSQ